MHLIKILKRESPVVVTREVIWRTRRAWNKHRAFGRLARPGQFKFRSVRYYNSELHTLSDQSRRFIVAFADELLAGRYPFLGYGTVELGTLPEWNLDFVSGRRWPGVRCSGRECVQHDGSDVKAPYKLSRLQFLPILGKAHVLTGEQAYRRAAKDLLSHWILSNPVPIGVNWTIAMEAALRAMSICFLLNLLYPFRKDEGYWLQGVARSLAQHLLYIEANLEFSHFLTSNHYLSDLVGLYCLSLFLEGQGMTARRRKYRRRIEAEMARQVYEDGGDYEASTGYHVLVTQLFTTSLLLMRTEGSGLPSPAFAERLRMMFRFLNTLASASGELPQVGDCDDGRTELLLDDIQQMLVHPVSERNSLRVSHLLGLGQRLFGEGEGPGDDAAWYGLVGSGVLSVVPSDRPHGRAFPHPEASAERLSVSAEAWRPDEMVRSAGRKQNGGSNGSVTVLPKSGIGVLRQGSAELLFFAVPNGIFGKGSHTHNDKLSFVLRVDGQEVICDSGTGCYTRNLTTRNQCRSTAAHNTLRIDGVEQNRIDPGAPGVFTLGNDAAVSPIQAGRKPGGAFLRASHTGYCSLGVMHTRTIRTVEAEGSFVIEDELTGSGVHNFELNLQLAPRRRAEIALPDNAMTCRIFGGRQVQLTIAGPGGLWGAVRTSRVSAAYGVTVPAEKVCVWGHALLPTRITTYISCVEADTNHSAQFASAQVRSTRDAVADKVHPV